MFVYHAVCVCVCVCVQVLALQQSVLRWLLNLGAINPVLASRVRQPALTCRLPALACVCIQAHDSPLPLAPSYVKHAIHTRRVAQIGVNMAICTD